MRFNALSPWTNLRAGFRATGEKIEGFLRQRSMNTFRTLDKVRYFNHQANKGREAGETEPMALPAGHSETDYIRDVDDSAKPLTHSGL